MPIPALSFRSKNKFWAVQECAACMGLIMISPFAAALCVFLTTSVLGATHLSGARPIPTPFSRQDCPGGGQAHLAMGSGYAPWYTQVKERAAFECQKEDPGFGCHINSVAGK